MTTSEAAPERRPRRPSVKPGERFELLFTDLLANGQAVGRHGALVVFCFGPLPGELARVAIVTVKPTYAVARLLDVVEPSRQRAEPFCPVFGDCGGCQLQHLDYAAQLQWKCETVRAALQRIGGFAAPDVEPAIGMELPRNYRNKMSLVVQQRSDGPKIGFYRARSHDVVPIDACPIAATQLSDYVGRLQRSRHDAEIAPALRDAVHVVTRESSQSKQAVVTVTTARPSQAVRHAAPALMAALPGAAGIVNSFGLSGANAILGQRNRLCTGSAEIEEAIEGVRYRVSPGSFFQVNVAMLAKIFRYIEPRLRDGRSIVDAYCGAGTFALFFASRGCSVTGIEEHAGAVAEARANATLNGLTAEFLCGRVERVVESGDGARALARVDVAFLDPPRKGCDEAALAAIVAAGVPEVWYLSCDPATLARDLKFLAANGYRLAGVQPFDMFPQTGHVEALATLRKV